MCEYLNFDKYPENVGDSLQLIFDCRGTEGRSFGTVIENSNRGYGSLGYREGKGWGCEGHVIGLGYH